MQHNSKEQLQARLRYVIETRGLKLREVCDITQIPYSSLQNYLRGEREPNLEALYKLSTRLNISLNWLVIGIGNVFIDEPNHLLKHIATNEESFLSEFKQLSPDAQQLMLKMMGELNK